ncbi:hypothetical protein DUNSADRAFT_10352 [Dunaliella salina]|uniref:Encoded protein n=1 Tax=Dunaliella salina TaxID=3046 RepID=A0ABQ7H4X5_DUNSA|nr:hypothetical protein DUNSADRAFT_10352 [Dunaliella salina]|eukprot:KAF5841915.1 hypothetical protein DUNSADRAFT_10352 [Dunaliella salina]
MTLNVGPRNTNPLNPQYALPGQSSWSNRPSTSQEPTVTYPVSRSLDCSDIVGAKPQRTKALLPSSRLSPPPLPLYSRPRPLGTCSGTWYQSQPRPSSTLTSQGIEGSTPRQLLRPFMPTPNAGTLNSGDIWGTQPRLGRYSCTRFQRTPNLYFGIRPRNTTLNRHPTEFFLDKQPITGQT